MFYYVTQGRDSNLQFITLCFSPSIDCDGRVWKKIARPILQGRFEFRSYVPCRSLAKTAFARNHWMEAWEQSSFKDQHYIRAKVSYKGTFMFKRWHVRMQTLKSYKHIWYLFAILTYIDQCREIVKSLYLTIPICKEDISHVLYYQCGVNDFVTSVCILCWIIITNWPAFPDLTCCENITNNISPKKSFVMNVDRSCCCSSFWRNLNGNNIIMYVIPNKDYCYYGYRHWRKAWKIMLCSW